MRHRFALAAVLAIGALALTSCGSSTADPAASESTGSDDLVALAQAEGQVDWYNGVLPATLEAVQKGFMDEYGIEVVAGERMSSAALGQRVAADVRSTGTVAADVIMTTDATLADYLFSEGLTEPADPAAYPDVDAVFLDNEAAVKCTMIVPVVGYNTAVLGDDFTIDSWDDLIDPALADQIMINDPRGSAAWSQMFSVLLQDPGLGEDYFTALAAQGYQPVASSLVGAEQLIAGQGSILLAGIPALFDPAIADGQSIDYWYPTDPSPVSFSVCPLVKDSPHPNAGKLFLQWLMTPEGQAALTETDSTASVIADLPGATVPQPADWTGPPAPFEVKQDTDTVLTLLGFN